MQHIVGLMLAVFLSQNLAWAEAYQPRVVNDSKKECAVINLSQGCIPPFCSSCSQPSGWRIVNNEDGGDGILHLAGCPNGYRDIGEIEAVCHANNNRECCSDSPSEFSLECDDLVLNPIHRQCAFVALSCALPVGWQRKSWVYHMDPLVLRWKCPTDSGWKWVKLSCK